MLRYSRCFLYVLLQASNYAISRASFIFSSGTSDSGSSSSNSGSSSSGKNKNKKKQVRGTYDNLDSNDVTSRGQVWASEGARVSKSEVS